MFVLTNSVKFIIFVLKLRFKMYYTLFDKEIVISGEFGTYSFIVPVAGLPDALAFKMVGSMVLDFYRQHKNDFPDPNNVTVYTPNSTTGLIYYI